MHIKIDTNILIIIQIQLRAHKGWGLTVSMLGMYQSNPGIVHWKAAKNVKRYLQGTKQHMLTYRKFDHFEVIGYSDSDFC